MAKEEAAPAAPPKSMEWPELLEPTQPAGPPQPLKPPEQAAAAAPVEAVPEVAAPVPAPAPAAAAPSARAPEPEPALPAVLSLLSDSASMQGRAPKQLDRHVKVPDLAKAARALRMPIDHLARDPLGRAQPCAFFAVYDGHQGPLCAEYVAKTFHLKLLKKLSAQPTAEAWAADETVLEALRAVFEELDAEFLNKYRTSLDGCVVVVSLLLGLRLFVAWVGHCRCLVARRGDLPGEVEAIAMTEDHIPSVEAEAKRVRDAGGVVFDYGMGFARVAHEGYEERMREMRRSQALGLGFSGKEPMALDVSRALGDRDFKVGKPLLVATPGLRSLRLDEDHVFFSLQSSGVPSVMGEEAMSAQLNAVREPADPAADVRAACGALVQEAYNLGSEGNLTAIQVRLRWPGEPAHTTLQRLAAVERAKIAAGGEAAKASAAAASRKRRQEAAANITAQKKAAYEQAVSGEAAIRNAADEAKKEAEVAVMRAEVEAAKVEVLRKEWEEQKREAAERAKAEAPYADPEGEGKEGGKRAGPASGQEEAEAFFERARKARREAAEAEAKARQAGATGEQPIGLDAAEAFFAARQKEAARKVQEAKAPVGLDAAEAFFAARKQTQEAAKVGMEAAEAFFKKREKERAEKERAEKEKAAAEAAAAAAAAAPAEPAAEEKAEEDGGLTFL